MTQEMALQHTAVTETADGFRVEVIYSNHADLEQASASVVIRLPLVIAEVPSPVRARAAALAYAQQLITVEIEKIPLPKRSSPQESP